MEMELPNDLPYDTKVTTAQAAAARAELRFEEVYQREENPLLRFAFTFTKSREQAEDFVQEAFMRLHQHWTEVEQPRAWLYRTVRNLSINWLKKHHREVHLEEWHEWGEMVESSPHEAMESLSSLQGVLGTLSEQDQLLVRMKYQENLKYSDIAEKTGLSVSNVGYKLHHILKQLADQLRKIGVDRAPKTH